MSQTYPRFQVQAPAGPYMRVVTDTWLGTEAARFYGQNPMETEAASPETMSERAQLLAETRAAELNLPSADPLRFVELLADHITRTINEAEGHPAEVLEDVSTILAHYAGVIRGTKVEPLRQEDLYHQATWVDPR